MVTFLHTFSKDGFETIETAFNIPARQICVSPQVPLQVRTLLFITKRSEEGCIGYGGGVSILVQRVQARGYKGQTIQVSQLLPDYEGEVSQ